MGGDFSEVEADTYPQTHGGAVGEIIEAHLVVHSGLDGDVLVEEKGVTDFWSEIAVVYLDAVVTVVTVARGES